MKRIFMLLAIGAALIATADAQEKTYTVPDWPAGIAALPCDAFKRNPDGSWTQVATVIVQSNSAVMRGNTFSTRGETEMLDRKCGTK